MSQSSLLSPTVKMLWKFLSTTGWFGNKIGKIFMLNYSSVKLQKSQLFVLPSYHKNKIKYIEIKSYRKRYAKKNASLNKKYF